MAKSDYLESAMLSWLKGTSFPAAPTTVYVGLHTAAPDEDASPTNELAATGSYARATITAASGWSAVSDDGSGRSQISNSGAVTFPTPSGNWGTVTHFSLWSAATSGNMWYWGALGTSRNIQNGDQAPSFAASTLVVKES
jgi:hypothetical protein